MKSIKFEHLEPRKSFFEDDFAKKIRAQEAPITSKDIGKFVDQLVAALKIKIEKDTIKTYIVETLSDEAIVRTFFQDQLSLWIRAKALFDPEAKKEVDHPPGWADKNDEILQVMRLEVRRIRTTVQEELKKRLTVDPALQEMRYSDFLLIESRPYRSLNAQRALDLNRRPHVLKRQRKIAPDHAEKGLDDMERERRLHQQAMQRLAQLPVHENLLRPDQFDDVRFESLIDEMELDDQEEEARHFRKKPYTFKEDLEVMRDCLLGAQFLVQHGLVLQDIHYANLGAYRKDDRLIGALFDLEGIFLLGKELFGRLSHHGFIPPEVDTEFSTPVLPSEMVYQFGKSFQCILIRWQISKTLPDEYKEAIWAIAESMMRYDKQAKNPVDGRLSLEESIDQFNNFLAHLPQDIGDLQ